MEMTGGDPEKPRQTQGFKIDGIVWKYAVAEEQADCPGGFKIDGIVWKL